jgi:hypothetical protein
MIDQTKRIAWNYLIIDVIKLNFQIEEFVRKRKVKWLLINKLIELYFSVKQQSSIWLKSLKYRMIKTNKKNAR